MREVLVLQTGVSQERQEVDSDTGDNPNHQTDVENRSKEDRTTTEDRINLEEVEIGILPVIIVRRLDINRRIVGHDQDLEEEEIDQIIRTVGDHSTGAATIR